MKRWPLAVAVAVLSLVTVPAGPNAHAAPGATETLTVSNSAGDVASSVMVMEASHSYRLVVTGTISDWCPPTATTRDQCSNGSPLAVGQGVDALYCYADWRCPSKEIWRQLRVNGQGLDEFSDQAGDMPFAPSHEYTVTVTEKSGPLTLTTLDGSRVDNSGSFTVVLTDLGPAGGDWPALPDGVVPLASVSNGCGGGKAGTEARFGDTSTYWDTRDTENPVKYVVNFREACNLHDAGYSGAKVADPFSGGAVVDFLTWNQRRVDAKFLADMRSICDSVIPAEAVQAREDCRGDGGPDAFGAQTRYDFVRRFGWNFFQERPRLRGLWSVFRNPAAPDWAVVQSQRAVRMTWRGTGSHKNLRGEFRGTLISRDDDSVIQGFAKVTEKGKTTIKPMNVRWDPDKPDLLYAAPPTGSVVLVK